MDRSEYIDCVIMSVAKMALLLDYDMDRVFEALYSVIKMNTKYDTTSGESARSAIKHNTQPLFSLWFLTLTLSAPLSHVPKHRKAGTSDRIVVTNRRDSARLFGHEPQREWRIG